MSSHVFLEYSSGGSIYTCTLRDLASPHLLIEPENKKNRANKGVENIRYVQKNKDEPGTGEKIKALSDYVKSSKFGMMTTRIADSGLLVSRCMAVAAQVCPHSTLISCSIRFQYREKIR